MPSNLEDVVAEATGEPRQGASGWMRASHELGKTTTSVGCLGGSVRPSGTRRQVGPLPGERAVLTHDQALGQDGQVGERMGQHDGRARQQNDLAGGPIQDTSGSRRAGPSARSWRAGRWPISRHPSGWPRSGTRLPPHERLAGVESTDPWVSPPLTTHPSPRSRRERWTSPPPSPAAPPPPRPCEAPVQQTQAALTA
jgi:hypothetical protein